MVVPKMAEVEGARQASGDKPSASAVYRNPKAVNGYPTLPTGDKTLFELFKTAAAKHGDKPCLGRRKDAGYSWLTYKQVRASDFFFHQT